MKPQKASEIPDLGDIWRVLMRRKWYCLIPLVLVSVIVTVGSRFLPLVYQSSTVVMIDRQVQISSELQRALGIDRGYQTDEQRSDELRGYRNELTSSYYLSRLADRMRLDQNPEMIANVKRIQAAFPELGAEQARLYILREMYAKSINVFSVSANQLQIAVESPRAAEARDLANTLAELFVTERLRQDVASVRSSQDFSNVQLEKYDRALQDKIAERTAFERNLLQDQLDTSVISETNRSQIQAEIDQTRQDISDNQERERSSLSQLASRKNVSTTNLILTESDPMLTAKESLKSQLKQLDEMLTKYPWNAPQMLNYRLKQNSYLSTIESESGRLVNAQFASFDEEARGMLARLFTARSYLDFLVVKNDYLTASIEGIRDRINRMPAYQAKLEGLNREIASATELRDRFKKQQEGSAISQELLQDVSSTKYRIIEPALLPIAPIRPDRMKISLIGILVGMVIGATAVFFAERMDKSFKKLQEVEEDLSLPVLGIVPRIPFLEQIWKQ
jgi:polysaccharide biosynthesis transport protein